MPGPGGPGAVIRPPFRGVRAAFNGGHGRAPSSAGEFAVGSLRSRLISGVNIISVGVPLPSSRYEQRVRSGQDGGEYSRWSAAWLITQRPSARLLCTVQLA